jgi:hypothetical protein
MAKSDANRRRKTQSLNLGALHLSNDHPRTRKAYLHRFIKLNFDQLLTNWDLGMRIIDTNKIQVSRGNFRKRNKGMVFDF